MTDANPVRIDLANREGGEEWIEAKNDRILGAFFQPSGDSRLHLTEMGRVLDEAESEKSSRGRRINVVLALVAAIILGWIAWPYYTLYELSVAVREGDSAALENRVEWESVRQGLRGDLNAMMLQKISADAKAGNSSAGAGFAAILGPAIINQLVEGCHSAGRG